MSFLEAIITLLIGFPLAFLRAVVFAFANVFG